MKDGLDILNEFMTWRPDREGDSCPMAPSSPWLKKLAALCDRIAAAEAIVGKLPKTYDGAAVTLGTRLFLHLHYDGMEPEVIPGCFESMRTSHEGIVGTFQAEGGSAIENIEPWQCYASESAARAASASPGAQGGTEGAVKQ